MDAPPVVSRILGASVAGASHVRAGLPCQDAFATATGADWVALAVADGLGSARASDAGAQCATRVAVAAARSLLDGANGVALTDACEYAVERARAALEDLSVERACALEDLACTLIVVVAREGQVCAAHVGDGAAVGEGEDGVFLLSSPADSEYVNVVTPLTVWDWRDAVRISEPLADVRAIALFTDGCQRAGLRPDGQPSAGFFEPLFAFARTVSDPDAGAREIAELLAGAKLAEHSDDDKTLLLAVLSP